MEIEAPVWLDEEHPNYERWKRARRLSHHRGLFVKSILLQNRECKNLNILDIGSGEGGTAAVLSKNNFVVSIDLSSARLKNQSKKYSHFSLVNGDALHLPFKKNYFDLIILQDVIEHTADPHKLILEAERVLNSRGVIYLSTPNKNSIINFLSDPHWGLPIVSILNRENIKYFFLRFFRKKDHSRSDTAQLLSLNDILKISGNFHSSLNTKFSVQELLNKNEGIIWSRFHLRLIGLIKIFRLENLLLKIANNNPGIINNYFTPTFYIMLKKK